MAVPLFLFVIGYGSVSPAVYGCCRICLCSGIRTDLFTDILPSDGKDGQVFSRRDQKGGSRAAFLKAEAAEPMAEAEGNSEISPILKRSDTAPKAYVRRKQQLLFRSGRS
jgi:hypothetical protein